MKSNKIILDLCGGTGSWSKPYKDAGYDVRLITLPENDVRLYIPPKKVQGILAAPPCTMFALSGNRWKRTPEQMIDALSIVDACIRIIFGCYKFWWVLENPVGKLVHYLGKPKMYFQPYEFGDPYTKRTCLWGNFTIPEKSPCEPLPNISNEGHDDPKKRFPSKMHLLPPTKNRQELRSITPPGFAKAFFEANP